jgi:uncharacterized coiled-coil DUF342 family protein
MKDNSKIENSCQYIDEVINGITDFCQNIDLTVEQQCVENEDVIDGIKHWTDKIVSMFHGYKSPLEKVRTIHNDLREWANDMHNACKEYEDTIYQLQSEISDLRNEVKALEKTIYDNNKETKS